MPSEVRYALVRKLLENNGWQHERTTGSHHIFVGEGRPQFSIPVHKGKVKPFYFKQVERAIEAVRKQQEEGDKA